jgi:hypothetical protein
MDDLKCTYIVFKVNEKRLYSNIILLIFIHEKSKTRIYL